MLSGCEYFWPDRPLVFLKTFTLYGVVIIRDYVRSGITPVRKGLLCLLLSYIVRTNIFKRKRGKG